MISDLNNAIKKADQIVIYGAGHIGDLLYSYICLLGSGAKVLAFAVSSTSGQAEHKHNVPVVSIGDARNRHPTATLIIAVHVSSYDVMADTARNSGFDHPIGFDLEELLDAFYNELYKQPIQKNKIFFMNYYGCGYGGNPKYIAQELITRNEDVEMVWGLNEDSHTFPKEIRTVEIGTYEFYSELATAGIWIDNVRKGLDARKREGQFYIQTWHGAAPFKKVESDLTGKVPQIVIDTAIVDSEKTDLFLSGSRFYTGLYRNVFGYKGEIFESGLPRMDVFWWRECAKKKVEDEFGIEDDKKIILYAPTFRDNGDTDAYNLLLDYVKEAVKDRFGRNSVVLVSRHPLNRNTEYHIKGEYVDAGFYDDFEELLAASDILITDYSGCIYDFSFTENPAFLYQPDHTVMKEQRDFYVQPEEMPYPLAHDMKELIDNIRGFDEKKYVTELRQFMQRFGDFDDGTASAKVCNRIRSIFKEG